MTPTVGALLAQQAPDLLGTAWGSILQAGAIGVLLFAALYLIVVRGLLRPEREFKAVEAQAAATRADCEKDLAEQKAEYEKRLADLRADYERALAAERARTAESISAYEQRISKYEAVAARQEAMIFDLTGATRSLAQVSERQSGGG